MPARPRVRLLLPALALLLAAALAPAQRGGGSVVDGKVHDGESITADLPGFEHIRNIGSKVDGYGMCVMTSIEMAARYSGLEEYRGLRDWCAREPGGAHPDKVDRQLAAYARAKGLPKPRYLQYEGARPEELLGRIDKNGLVACVTYGYSPRYRGTIAHMVCGVRYKGQWAVVLDNNYVEPREQSYEWMSFNEFVRRLKHPSGQAWVFVWLSQPPPPPVRGP